MKWFITFFFMSSLAQAFTLNNNIGASFSKKKVKVRIASNTTCATAGVTIYELADMINPAVNDFWNRVPTSSLRLSFGGYAEPVSNVQAGRLCSPTDSACITAAGVNLIPAVDEIVIACNDNLTNFGQANVIAVTIPNHFSGSKIKGALILINDTSNVFALLSRNEKIAVLAHEIGHAIGLGHSENNSALMYYKSVSVRKALGQDDVDGVSYLYPVKIDACGLFSGTIKTDGIDPQVWQMSAGFFMILVLAKLKKLFQRA